MVAVHGRDQDTGFLREVADRVDLPQVHWLAPAADGDTWYPLSFLAPLRDNEPRLSWAVGAVDAARAQLAAEGHGPERVALLGFSQGAVVLAEHLLRGGAPCAGAALLTGGYAGPGDRTTGAALVGMPVLLGSSAYDVLVPVERVRQTGDLLAAAGAAVTLEVYDDREHLVSDRAVASTRSLLTAALSRTAVPGR